MVFVKDDTMFNDIMKVKEKFCDETYCNDLCPIYILKEVLVTSYCSTAVELQPAAAARLMGYTCISDEEIEDLDLLPVPEIKIFISQPMTGIPEEVILKKRDKLISLVTSKFGNKILRIANPKLNNVTIVNSSVDFDDSLTPLAQLSKDIELLSKADFAVFAEGWNNSKGCYIEHECCKQYFIPTYYQIGDKIEDRL